MIIEYVGNNPGKRAPYIAKALGVPLKTLERWLKKAKAEGKIKYEEAQKQEAIMLSKKGGRRL